MTTIPEVDSVRSFDDPKEAVSWVLNDPQDICFMETEISGMKGAEAAEELREADPGMKIVFLTSDPGYALEAFRVHASGYLIKPVSQSDLSEEINFALSGGNHGRSKRVRIQTFGNFEVYVGSETVKFRRSRAKELLAYLVDRQGSTASRTEAFSMIFENDVYDRPRQKQFDVIVRSMKDTLSEYGISHIIEIERTGMRVVPEMVDCDLYRFQKRDPEALKSYRGEYMSSYSWSAPTEAYMTSYVEKNE